MGCEGGGGGRVRLFMWVAAGCRHARSNRDRQRDVSLFDRARGCRRRHCYSPVCLRPWRPDTLSSSRNTNSANQKILSDATHFPTKPCFETSKRKDKIQNCNADVGEKQPRSCPSAGWPWLSFPVSVRSDACTEQKPMTKPKKRRAYESFRYAMVEIKVWPGRSRLYQH